MKRMSFLRFISCSALFIRTLNCTALALAMSGTYFEAQNYTSRAVCSDYTSYFANNNDLIIDAFNNIKKYSHVSRAKCIYDLKTTGLTGMALKKMSTKIYYSKYHKKPSLKIKDFQPELVTDKTVEICYNPKANKHSINFTVYNANGKIIKEEDVRLPACCTL